MKGKKVGGVTREVTPGRRSRRRSRRARRPASRPGRCAGRPPARSRRAACARSSGPGPRPPRHSRAMSRATALSRIASRSAAASASVVRSTAASTRRRDVDRRQPAGARRRRRDRRPPPPPTPPRRCRTASGSDSPPNLLADVCVKGRAHSADVPAQLQLGREAARVGPARVAGLDPGDDVAGRLQRRPQAVRSGLARRDVAERRLGRRGIVGEAAPQQVHQIVARERPRREPVCRRSRDRSRAGA